MKRFLLLTLLAILIQGIATAQNANRHGFFLEAGIGGLIGNTPRSSISVINNEMQFECVSGGAIDFALGDRLRVNNHWAYELKAEGQIPLGNPINALVGRLLPIGFRYTSIELWRNYSLYVHANLGGAIVVNNGIINYGNNNLFDSSCLLPNMPQTNIKGYVGLEGYGMAYSIGIGANLTTHLYVEGCMNAQVMFACYGKNGRGMLNYGIAAFVVGYRF